LAIGTTSTAGRLVAAGTIAVALGRVGVICARLQWFALRHYHFEHAN